MRIRPTDFVLEIGSGHSPRPRADVLCDKFIENDDERGGAIVSDRPLVEADAQALPFADGAFDYVICLQVLEHVEDPERMLRELMRVASRGRIETPSEIAERLYGWPFHKSVINLIDGKLVIQPKTIEDRFGQLFHVLAARDKEFARFHQTHASLFLIQYEWEGKIDFEIRPPGPSAVDLSSPAAVEAIWERIARTRARQKWVSRLKHAVPQPLAGWGKSVLARGRRGHKKTLREIVVCPACKGRVEWLADRITCPTCPATYPMINGIPRLLVPSGSPPHR